MCMVQELLLQEIAKRFTGEGNCIKNSRIGHLDHAPLNLLGVTPLDFGPQLNVEMHERRILKAYGWKVLSTWAMGDALENLSRSRRSRSESGGIFGGTSGCERYLERNSELRMSSELRSADLQKNLLQDHEQKNAISETEARNEEKNKDSTAYLQTV